MADGPCPNSVEEMRKWMDLVKKMFDGAPPEQRHDMHEHLVSRYQTSGR